MRPSGANCTTVGLVMPLSTTVSWNPLGSTDASAARLSPASDVARSNASAATPTRRTLRERERRMPAPRAPGPGPIWHPTMHHDPGIIILATIRLTISRHPAHDQPTREPRRHYMYAWPRVQATPASAGAAMANRATNPVLASVMLPARRWRHRATLARAVGGN